jgi:hypothetical protein
MKKKSYIPNERVFINEKDAYLKNMKQKHEDKIKRLNERFEKDKAHYASLLDDMVSLAIGKIKPNSSLKHIQKVCSDGNSAWKIICARVRQTNSVLKLNIDAFENQFTIKLKEIYENSTSN